MVTTQEQEQLRIKKTIQEQNKLNRNKEVLPYAERLVNGLKGGKL